MINKLVKLLPIFYKDLSGTGYNGRAYGLWIVIDKNKSKDKGLLAHERVHCRQFIKTLGLHGILYKVSKDYKYKAEVEAFGYSIAYGSRTKEDVRLSLSNYYGVGDYMKDFDIDIEIAIQDAKEYIDGND